jgi:hypothetical protein
MRATATAPDLDPMRMMVAAHELGHAVVWLVTGTRVVSIEVTGRGRGTEGTVQLVASDRLTTVDDCRSYLLGILAGREAEDRWYQATDTRPVLDGCAHDRRAFDHINRRPWGVTESRAELRHQARQLVRQHWPTIARHAPRLARRGRLSVADLPQHVPNRKGVK